MIEYILTDIEGTTTSITFVHDVLFPYASKHLPSWVRSHRSEKRVQAALDSVAATILAEENKESNESAQIEKLLEWIQNDRKHPALKSIQGFLWQDGYENGSYTAHIYDDVPESFAKWKEAGLKMGVYSSGSVPAQRLLFGYSEKGDLQPYFSDYFDTAVGHKREIGSYKNISRALGLAPEKILFLSDIPEELSAAQAAGMQVLHLVRPGTKTSSDFQGVESFAEIDLSRF